MNRLIAMLLLTFFTVTAFSQPIRQRRVYVHHGPVVVNRNPVVVNRGQVVVNRSPVVVGRGPAFVSRPPMYYPYHGVNFRFSGGYYYRPYGSYWRMTVPPIGLRVGMLPYGYSSFYFGGMPYYAYDGIYYRRYDDNNYEVVDPPMGATLSSLPRGAKSVLVNGEEFYELNGTYYKESVNEKGKTVYVVTGKNGEVNNSTTPDEGTQNFTPQQGDIVDQLPDNCKTITLHGNTYYVAPDDTYYQSIEQDGTTRYEVVGAPSEDVQN